MKNMDRLTSKFARCDLRTLTDFMAATMANIEDACLQAGGVPGEDYIFSDLVSWSVGVMNASSLDKDLTMEDVEPLEKRIRARAGPFDTSFMCLLEGRFNSLKAAGDQKPAAMAKISAEFAMPVREVAGLLRHWKDYNQRFMRGES